MIKRCRVEDYGRKNVNATVKNKEDAGGRIKIHRENFTPKDYTRAFRKISQTRDGISYILYKKLKYVSFSSSTGIICCGPVTNLVHI